MTDTPLDPGALAAYRASQRLDQRPVAILAAVHGQLYAALASAKSAYEARALDQMCRHAERASRLMGGLVAALDPSVSSAAAELSVFYGRTQNALNRIQHDRDASSVLHQSIIMLRAMCSEFYAKINAP